MRCGRPKIYLHKTNTYGTACGWGAAALTVVSMLLSEYNPIGELNCLCTSCVFGIEVVKQKRENKNDNWVSWKVEFSDKLSVVADCSGVQCPRVRLQTCRRNDKAKDKVWNTKKINVTILSKNIRNNHEFNRTKFVKNWKRWEHSRKEYIWGSDEV